MAFASQMSFSKRRRSLNLSSGLIYASLTISFVMVFALISILVGNGTPALLREGFGLFSFEWHPAQNKFGILPMLYGTFIVALIAVLLATPIGTLCAIAISEYLPRQFRIQIKGLLELLAGIPSIIYGLIGIAVLAPFLANNFELQSGRTILAGGVLLAIMILPTIITLSEDALYNIPDHYRETSAGLGLFKFEIIKDVLWPIAKTDIIGAILLALGRALGETMAVMLVIGSIDRIPTPFTNVLSPGQTITSKLGREVSESAFGSPHFQALIFLALLLVLVGLVMTLMAQFMIRKGEVRLDN